ncbi:MAG: RluA family pseudouridine synthase [Thermoanaerobaculia bacterium]
MNREETWAVRVDEAGERLDRHVAARLDLPRNRVQRWIREGHISVGGTPARPSQPVAAGEVIRCHIPPAAETALAPEPGELSLLYEDADLLALDKPAGLTVHPGAGRSTGTLVHRLLEHYPDLAAVGSLGRPGIVHRLDKDTSGVLLVARTDRAYRALSRAFAERRIDKRYLAVVWGDPGPDERVLDFPVGRHPTHRKEMTVRPDGRPARSRLRRLAAAGPVSLVEVRLETGRTHQIRVHLKYARHALVGDPVYGEARWKEAPRDLQRVLRDFPRPGLHAWRLGLQHPTTGEPLELKAPPPADLEVLWMAVAAAPLPVAPARPTNADAVADLGTTGGADVARDEDTVIGEAVATRRRRRFRGDR